MSRVPSRNRFSNKILTGLPAIDASRVYAALRPVALVPNRVLLTPSRPVSDVYFLNGGVCSLVQSMQNGKTAEIATVGSEGFIGVEALLGGASPLCQVQVKIADAEAMAMGVGAFRREMRRQGAFAAHVVGYALGLFSSLTQSVACNALHSVEQRCARWLLTMGDRAGRHDVMFTHASLAAGLGVRRSTVTLAIGALQESGLIDYAPRRVVILNRAGLKSVSCECYGAIAKHYARLR